MPSNSARVARINTRFCSFGPSFDVYILTVHLALQLQSLAGSAGRALLRTGDERFACGPLPHVKVSLGRLRYQIIDLCRCRGELHKLQPRKSFTFLNAHPPQITLTAYVLTYYITMKYLTAASFINQASPAPILPAALLQSRPETKSARKTCGRRK